MLNFFKLNYLWACSTRKPVSWLGKRRFALEQRAKRIQMRFAPNWAHIAPAQG
jgi:hypothetical protein